MIELLAHNPLLLFFVVAALGYLVGRVPIGGFNLGATAVLFVGLAVGALDPRLKLPEFSSQLGLVLTVYTVGLSSGRQFFASFGHHGLRDNLFTIMIITLAGALTVAAYIVFGLRPGVAAGVFNGSTSNASALAATLEYLHRTIPPDQLSRVINDPTVGFSLGYPMALISVILSIVVMQRLWKIDYVREAEGGTGHDAGGRKLFTRVIRITCPEATQTDLQTLCEAQSWDIAFGRVKSDGVFSVVTRQTTLALGDLVSAIGTPEELDRATAYLGEPSAERLDLDRSELDFRRVFVSNPRIVGQPLKNLHLTEQLGATVTRVRRGDAELVAHSDTRLQLGDRVRVVARRTDMDAVSKFFGDSFRSLSEIDVLTFTIGMSLGILLGLVAVPLPGGLRLRLGIAGGPLVAGLILGALERTGPLVWSMPYNANLTLRQFGLVLFLAGVGTGAGYDFWITLTQGNGLLILLVSLAIALIVCFVCLLVGYRLLKIPMGLLIGMLVGIQTQPGTVSFAL